MFLRHHQLYHFLIDRLDRSSASRRFMSYLALNGIQNGIFGFAEVIARKSLDGSGLAITALSMSNPIAAFTSLWWVRIVEGRDQRKMLLWVGSLGFLAMATWAFLYTMSHLLIVCFIFFLAYALIGPCENRIMQQHIASKDTGKTFGIGNSVRMAVVAVVAGLAGMWMEHHEGGFRQLFIIAAITGWIALVILASIRMSAVADKEKRPIDRTLILSPLREVKALLTRRKDYLRFEIAFMFYGVAFMMTLPVVPLYIVDDLKLGYDTIGLARGTVMQLVMVAAMPFFGRMYDKSTPHRMGVLVFGGLSLYPLFMLSCKYLTGTMQTAMVFFTFSYFGVMMSGITILWQLSSIRFSAGEDSGIYHSVHFSATAVRGSVAPLLGYLLMTYLSKTTALIASSCCFLFAAGLMVVMRKIDFARGEATTLRVG